MLVCKALRRTLRPHQKQFCVTLFLGMGWSCESRVCTKKQNTKFMFQVSSWCLFNAARKIEFKTYVDIHRFNCFQNVFTKTILTNVSVLFCYSSRAVAEMLEKNYKIHCSLNDIVRTIVCLFLAFSERLILILWLIARVIRLRMLQRNTTVKSQ